MKDKRSLKEKYGLTAMVAGASEGIGAAFATFLAEEGMDLVLIARREVPLQQFAASLEKRYAVRAICIACDLSFVNATRQIEEALNGIEINLLVYNAALSYIGPFIKNSAENHRLMAQANMLTPLDMLHTFGGKMLSKGCGGIVLMTSLAGLQGSGFLSMYAATKAFNRIMAESLWYEWRDNGVDVIACCAGATSTLNFIETKPEKTTFLAPRVLKPEEVAKECLERIGCQPSFITGRGNRIASFFMQKIFPRKTAITIMGNTTRKMYKQQVNI
jgi:short-subunit dehydrogenase